MEGLNSTQKIVSIFAGDDLIQGNIISKRTKELLGCNTEILCINCNNSCSHFKQEQTKNIIKYILDQSFYASLNLRICK